MRNSAEFVRSGPSKVAAQVWRDATRHYPGFSYLELTYGGKVSKCSSIAEVAEAIEKLQKELSCDQEVRMNVRAVQKESPKEIL